MKCVIIAGGHLTPSERIKTILNQTETIICADSGARHLRSLGLLPHVLIGDFDSIDPDDLAFFRSHNVLEKKYPARKDQTDSEICVAWAAEHHASDITMLGATGSRLDHTLGNLFLLKKMADLNIRARIIDAHNDIYLVHDVLSLDGAPGDLLSILPLTRQASGITLTGLEYPAVDATFEMGRTIGISNCFAAAKVTITVKNGLLAVIKSQD